MVIRKSLYKNIIELITNIPIASLVLFMAGCIGIVFLFYMSLVYWRVSWYSLPDFSFSFLLRTFIIALSVSLIAISAKTDHLKEQFAFTQNQIIAVLGMMTLTVICFVLCTIFPETARILGEEDNIVEWGSFATLFLGLAIILLIFLKKLLSLKDNPFTYLLLLFFAFLLFLMGMEEISWGQRIFGLQTPDIFKENSQNEINLHNFVTTGADTGYYIGICILFIILPYLKLCFPAIFSKQFFQLLVPGPYIIIVGVLPFAFHYNKWNLLFTQIWFFSALIITLIIALSQKRYRTGNFFFLASFLICFMQVTFLTTDNTNPVLFSGRIAEYKELISQSALLIYSIDVYFKVKKSINYKRIKESLEKGKK